MVELDKGSDTVLVVPEMDLDTHSMDPLQRIEEAFRMLVLELGIVAVQGKG